MTVRARPSSRRVFSFSYWVRESPMFSCFLGIPLPAVSRTCHPRDASGVAVVERVEWPPPIRLPHRINTSCHESLTGSTRLCYKDAKFQEPRWKHITHLTKTDQADVAQCGAAVTTSSAVNVDDFGKLMETGAKTLCMECTAEAGFLNTAPPPKPIR